MSLVSVLPVIFCLYLNDLLLWLTPVKLTAVPTISSVFLPYIYIFLLVFIYHFLNCLWIVLLWIFWNFRDFTVLRLTYCISNFVTDQIAGSFCCFLNWYFWISFKRICCRLFDWSRSFWQNLPLESLPISLSTYLAKDRIP